VKRVLIFGATSAIARAAARLFAERGDRLYLVARDPAKLEVTANDLRVRGAPEVASAVADLNDFEGHPALVQGAWQALGGQVDVVLVAHGTLSDQSLCEKDFSAARRELETNFLSVVSLLTDVANRMEAQRSGTIAVISSVAGDRGRRSNYLYGTAKGATTIFLQGLRARLFHAGVAVVTIKPGFVDSPMTADLKKNPLYSSPERVARDIVGGIDKGRDVVYTPAFWRIVMGLIGVVPERLFKRLKL